ncbi:hypothetical protein GCM10010403_38010 [Glycomyces rutgersensis]|uniref:Uncharacterized protein n=1 Tax=Glycomyces rutgersensis TaxID=58115 RepID=A0ABN3G081_9ACTN
MDGGLRQARAPRQERDAHRFSVGGELVQEKDQLGGDTPRDRLVTVQCGTSAESDNVDNMSIHSPHALPRIHATAHDPTVRSPERGSPHVMAWAMATTIGPSSGRTTFEKA